jgi:hypothetical protein
MSTSTYKVVFNGTTQEAKVIPGANGTPAGFVNWGTFDRTDGTHVHDSHALYHRVRDLAYKAGHQNMQIKKITLDASLNFPAPAT